MAKRKEHQIIAPNELPKELRLGRASAALFIDENEPLPEDIVNEDQAATLRLYNAVRRRNLARRDFLAQMRVKPSGVGILEFLNAHGYTTEQIKEARNAGLTF